MGKFCTSCGASLDGGAKFCANCGANVFPPSVEVGTARNQALPDKKAAVSSFTEKIKTEVRDGANTYTKNSFSDAVPAYKAAGELVLPLELAPVMGGCDGEDLWSVLKRGFGGLIRGLKGTLGNKKLLLTVIALVITWLLVNLLAARGIFPLPLRVLAWLTAARGSLIGGTIGKGLVAALLARIITNKKMFQSVKSGISQLGTRAKDGQEAYGPLLLGGGAALIACNMMVATDLQNTMVCIAGFTLSAAALTQNGFLRRLTNSLLPKANDGVVTDIMGGWTLGFVLFAVVSLLPGGLNGYLLGVLLMIAGGVLAMVYKNREEVTKK